MIDPISNPLLITVMLTLLGFALLSDVRARRIPNQLVLMGLVLGLTGNAWTGGVSGLTIAASGALVGLLCLLPFYVSGMLGAGDVKLMAMCGAFLGPLQVVMAAVASLLVGGVIGVIWAFWHFSAGGEDSINDSNPSASVPVTRHQVTAPSAIPYALAIAAGVLISLKAAPLVLQTLIGGVPS